MGFRYVEDHPHGEDDAGFPGGAGDTPRVAATPSWAGMAMPGASNAGHAAPASIAARLEASSAHFQAAVQAAAQAQEMRALMDLAQLGPVGRRLLRLEAQQGWECARAVGRRLRG